MNELQGLVNRIIRFSAVDGPGNRLVIFLQGCNFRCLSCHNPHTIGVCTLCGICIQSCPAKALYISSTTPVELKYDDHLCHNCDYCLEICPVQSNPRAHWFTVREILKVIRESAPFLSGITISGGEATLQAEFLKTLFTVMKNDQDLSKLSIFVDSNGSASLETWEKLLPVIDGVMLDLKAFNPTIHRQLTGADNGAILEVIPFLYRRKKLYEVRLLLIADFNTDRAEMLTLADYLANIGKDLRIKLISFRRHGVRRENLPFLREPGEEKMQECKKIFFDKGFRKIDVT